MRKLAAHYDTLGVLAVLCPLAGVGAGLAFANGIVGLCAALGSMAIVSRLAPGRALAASLQTRELPPSMTDLALSVAAETDRYEGWVAPVWDPEAATAGERRTAQLVH